MTILILSEGQGRRLINDDRLQFLDISESKARSCMTQDMSRVKVETR